MKRMFAMVAVVLVAAACALTLFSRGAWAENVSWESNLTVTVRNATDATNSTVVFQPVGTKVPIRFFVETPSAGAVAWALSAASISTGNVASLPAIPASTYSVIEFGGGYMGPLHMRFQTVTTNLNNTIKIKAVGYQ